MKRQEIHHGDTEGTERAGIVLILVSGVLVMLALLAAVFIQLTGFQEKGRGGRLAMTRARIAAECGMEYAAARLTRDRVDMSAARTVAARGDDWQYRGGGEYRREPADPLTNYPVPERLEETLNPSYSHGECWEDNAVPGHYEPGDNLAPGIWTDTDGNGRFSAWSGRVRGGKGPLDMRFTLKVEPGPSCRINVNGGDLGRPWSGACYGLGKGTDFRNQEIAMSLSALGVVLGMDVTDIGMSSGATHRVYVSGIGNRLLTKRPLISGYRSLQEVKAALVPAPLTDAQWRVLEPHLTLVDFDDGVACEELDFSPNSAVPDLLDLQGAPAALLNSYWSYRMGMMRSARLFYYSTGDLRFQSGGVQPDPWTNQYFGEMTTFFPEEIAPIVGEIVHRRRFPAQPGQIDGFSLLYQKVVQEWMQDHGHGPTVGTGAGGATASERSLYLARKADLFMAYARRSIPPVRYVGNEARHIPPRSWGTRALDRDPAAGRQAEAANPAFRMFDFPPTGVSYSGKEPYDLAGWGAPREHLHKALWFGPIRSFRVTSRGGVGSPGGAFRVEESDFQAGVGLFFFSQEHFENLGYRRDKDSPNILPGRPRRMAGDAALCELGSFDQAQSLPFVYPGKSFWVTGSNGGYSITNGGITLAEGPSDFPVLPVPMIQWEFTPDAALDVYPGTMTNGADHARGTGTYPFTDNAPQPLFVAGEKLEAYNQGSLTGTAALDGMCATVGLSDKNITWVIRAMMMTGSDHQPFPDSNLPARPPALADPARKPAPFPMLPYANSAMETIDIPLPSPRDKQQAADNWDYVSHPRQPRCFLEGGIEAWVAPENLADGSSVNHLALTSGGYSWSDPANDATYRGAVFQKIGICSRPGSSGGYIIFSEYAIPAVRCWNRDPFANPAGSFTEDYLLSGTGCEIHVPGPVRQEPGPGDYDHLLVKWRVRKVTPYEPDNPPALNPLRDVMPRIETDLVIKLNGIEVHNQPHVATMNYRLDAGGQIVREDPGNPESMPEFVQTAGFVPPFERLGDGSDSYMDLFMRSVDQVAVHGTFNVDRVAFKDRFLASGSYESPRIDFPRAATLRWAGWTATASEKLQPLGGSLTTTPVSCTVQATSSGAGTQTAAVGTLAEPAAWLDMKGVGSARFNVEFRIPPDPDDPTKVHPDFCDDPVAPAASPVAEGTGAFVDPPVFEDMSLYFVMPRWLSRE